MSDAGRRVALLARPGAARDSVRGALIEIGADIVVEDDPGSASPESVRSASPEVLMIVLDAISENALDRFDSMLGDPSIEVMFEEADVAAARDGWEAARWRRHLAAKLHHRDDVLPPVAGGEPVPGTDTLSMQIEAMIGTGSQDASSPDMQAMPADAGDGNESARFDPAGTGTSGDVESYVLSVHGLELEPSALDAPLPDLAGLELDLASLDAPLPVTGPDFTASDFDPLLAELDAELPDRPVTASAVADGEWSGGLVEAFNGVDDAPDSRVESPSAPPPLPRASFGELSLAEDAPLASPPATTRTHDLGDLERRISSLELVGDAPAPSAPAAPMAAASPGAVLVLAGIGGPDAVRQLLGALPVRFPRPVLLRQRLDGARYDKLVAQLKRASALPVELAVPGAPVLPGHVHVLADDVGLSADGAMFTTGDEAGVLHGLQASDSAVVVLSGADAGLANAIDALRSHGAFVGAQSEDGCYDPAAAVAVARQGGLSGTPAELALQLVGRWGG